MKRLLLLSAHIFLSIQLLVGSDGYPINPDIDIIHYQFTISLSDNSDIIKGRAEICIVYSGVTEKSGFDLKSLNKDGKGMVVDKVLVDGSGVVWLQRENRIVIDHTNPVKKGDTINVMISYSGIPADGMIISTNRHGQRTFFADNWPDRASNWIPCVDHPSDKATVDFIVYAPSHYSVVSNGYLYEESTLPGNIKLTHWKEEVPISTKVMVIGLAEFSRQLAGKVGDTEIWSWIFPEESEKGFYDYSVAIEPFTFFSNEIGDYAYEKLANVQSRTIFGGMENAGCVFYSERSVTGRGEAEGLIAHELAHQWFGNSVTERDWHHIWLSEGFATYFTAYYMESKYGSSRLKSDMQRSRTRVVDAYNRAPAPLVDTTITNFMKLLSTNSYQKGAWVLHMLRSELGDKYFIDGIRTYFSRYKNSTALSSDFISVMEEVSGSELTAFFEQWLYRDGMPSLSVSWDYNNRNKEVTVVVEQSQNDAPYTFPLEIQIITDSGSRLEKVRIDQQKSSFIFKSDGSVVSIKLDPEVKLLYRAVDN